MDYDSEEGDREIPAAWKAEQKIRTQTDWESLSDAERAAVKTRLAGAVTVSDAPPRRRRGGAAQPPQEQTLGAAAKNFQHQLEKAMMSVAKLVEFSDMTGHTTQVTLCVSTTLPEQSLGGRSRPDASSNRVFVFSSPQANSICERVVRRNRACATATAAQEPAPSSDDGEVWRSFANEGEVRGFFEEFRLKRARK